MTFAFLILFSQFCNSLSYQVLRQRTFLLFERKKSQWEKFAAKLRYHHQTFERGCCKTSNGINNSLFLTFECKTRRTTEKIQHFLKFSDLFESLLKPPVWEKTNICACSTLKACRIIAYGLAHRSSDHLLSMYARRAAPHLHHRRRWGLLLFSRKPLASCWIKASSGGKIFPPERRPPRK